jgi:hypothetical protein
MRILPKQLIFGVAFAAQRKEAAGFVGQAGDDKPICFKRMPTKEGFPSKKRPFLRLLFIARLRSVFLPFGCLKLKN